MKVKNTSTHYGLVSITLHWVMAITIFGLYGVGLYMVELTYYDELYRVLPYWHKSIGVLIAGLLIFRIIWKHISAAPKALSNHKPAEKVAAKVAHILLYVLIAGIVISGYMISTADGRAIEVFNWFSIPALDFNIENQEDIAGQIHEWLAHTLIFVVAIHALGAVKHHIIDKDSTLTRMLGFLRK